MQLVAYGAQDVYLTGNPKVTFFQAVYKRHTNFAMEVIQQTTNGSPAASGRVSVTIARNGDLVGNMHVALTPASNVLTSNNSVFDTNWVAERAIAAVELTIGGQRIDKHYQTWWRLYAEVFLNESDKYAWGKMTTMANPIAQGSAGTVTSALSPSKVYLPLLFFFNRNPGLYLPLIALQYHEVRINLEFDSLNNLCWDYSNSSDPHAIRNRVGQCGLAAASLYVDYIYLDTDERRKMAQNPHEYLIEQLQFTGDESVGSSSNKIKLNFNHPCKELVWVVQRDSFVACDDATVNPWKGQQPFNFSDWWDRSVLESGYSVTRFEGMAGKNPCITALLQLNGHDRFQVREGRYFNEVQPYQHHTNIPAVGINVYSFALQPEQHQPSGTCNLSRIDNTTLLLTVSNNAVGTATSATVRVYATNYNVLRIMSGMGGLAYSN